MEREHDICYARHDGVALHGTLFMAATPVAALVCVHGGAWTRGDRSTYAAACRALARRGITALSIDFRMPPVARYPEPIRDINAAIRWLKGRLCCPVGGLGLSSGGHQLMLCALRPNDPRYTGAPQPPGDEVDARLAFVAIGYGVLDPSARYAMAVAAGRDELVAAHHAYWPVLSAMDEANPTMALDRGEPVDLPPVLVVEGTEDRNLPPGGGVRFARLYRRRGGQVTAVELPGVGHAFLSRDPSGAAFHQAIDMIERFVVAVVAGRRA
jgi:acetyl esterase/lipase